MLYSAYLECIKRLGDADILKVTKEVEGTPIKVLAWWNPIFDRTLDDCIYGNPRGCLDFAALNRISADLEFLQQWLIELAYDTRFNKDGNFPHTREQYLFIAPYNLLKKNKEYLYKAFYVQNSEPLPVSKAGDLLTLEEVNAIEKYNFDLFNKIQMSITGCYCCADMYAGNLMIGGE